jgi:hypothetical protein
MSSGNPRPAKLFLHIGSRKIGDAEIETIFPQ